MARIQRATNQGFRATRQFFYDNIEHGIDRRTQFQKVVFFIEDKPNYQPVIREEAAIKAFA
jgi:hypothetical protein